MSVVLRICPFCQDEPLSVLKKADDVYVCAECFERLPNDQIQHDGDEEEEVSFPNINKEANKEAVVQTSAAFLATKSRITDLTQRLSSLRTKNAEVLEKVDASVPPTHNSRSRSPSKSPERPMKIEKPSHSGNHENTSVSSPISQDLLKFTHSQTRSPSSQSKKVSRGATLALSTTSVVNNVPAPVVVNPAAPVSHPNHPQESELAAVNSLLSSQVIQCMKQVDQSVKFLSQVKDLIQTEAKDDPTLRITIDEQSTQIVKLKKTIEEMEKNSSQSQEMERELNRLRTQNAEVKRELERLKQELKNSSDKHVEISLQTDERVRILTLDNHRYQTEATNAKQIADSLVENTNVLQQKIDNLNQSLANKDGELVVAQSQANKLTEQMARLQEESENQMRQIFDVNGKLKNSDKRVKTLQLSETALTQQLLEVKEKLNLAEKEIEALHPIQIDYEKKSKLYERTFVENQNFKAQLFENIQASQAASLENERLTQELDSACAISEEFASQFDTAKQQVDQLLELLKQHNIPSPF